MNFHRKKKDVLPRTRVNLKKRRGEITSSPDIADKLVKWFFIVVPMTAMLSFLIGGYTFYKFSSSSSSLSSSLSEPLSIFKGGEESSSISTSIDDIEPEFPYFGSSVLNSTTYRPLGGLRFKEYIDGGVPYDINKKDIMMSDQLAAERKQHIKNAMKHAWDGYSSRAFGADEIKPVSGKPNTRKFGGVAVTLVDALDTLWLMDMKEEFELAREWIKDHLTFDLPVEVSVFETTIRSLGGLVSAYEWSGATVFLEKAEDLAKRLLKTFNKSAAGMPYGLLNLQTGRMNNNKWLHCNTRTDVCACIAEIGTMQVEFGTLAEHTGNPSYREKTDAAFDSLKAVEVFNGLYPSVVEVDNVGQLRPATSGKLTMGGTADSFYEYMLKLWLQGNKKEQKYRDMYDRAIDAMHNMLLWRSQDTGLWIIGSTSASVDSHHARASRDQRVKNRGGDNIGSHGQVPHMMFNQHVDLKMEHLTCFMGMLYALQDSRFLS